MTPTALLTVSTGRGRKCLLVELELGATALLLALVHRNDCDTTRLVLVGEMPTHRRRRRLAASVSLPPPPALTVIAGSEGGVELKSFEVYRDSACPDGATLNEQAVRGHDMRAKVPPARNANGYSKDQFTIDLAAGTVTCPARHTVTIGMGARHRSARFGALCQSCPLRADCTTARRGRVISIHPHEAALQRAKAANSTRPGSRTTGNIVPSWNARSATSPAVPGVRAQPAAADRNAS